MIVRKQLMNVDNASQKLGSKWEEKKGCCMKETQRSRKGLFLPHKHSMMEEIRSFSPERVNSWKVKEKSKLKNHDFPLKRVQYLNTFKNAFTSNVTWSLQNNPVEQIRQVKSPIEMKIWALAGVAQWTECQPAVNQKVMGSNPSLGHMPGLQAKSLAGGT